MTTGFRRVAWVCAGFAWLGACGAGGPAPSQGAGLIAASGASAPAADSGRVASAAGSFGVAGASAAAHAGPSEGGSMAGRAAAGASAAQGVSRGQAGNAAGAGQAGVTEAAGAAGIAAVGGGAAGRAGVSAAMSSGSGGSASKPAFHACPSDGSPCKIMPFGDSITDGYNPDTPGGYRIELFRLAHAAGKNLSFVGSGSNGPTMVDGVAFPQQHEGHSGWTIAPAGGRSGISTLVDTVMPQYTPDIVLLMIGTNDAIDNYQMAEAPTRLGALIDAVYAQLPAVVIVVAQLIPARGDAGQGDDAALSARIQSFNAAIPALVKARAEAGKQIFSVDMFTPFAREPRALLQDQWHPNAAGYALIGAEWYAAIQSLL